MLTFNNLSLVLPNQKTAIYPTTGQILPNQFIVLTGSSGSGKSLLLRLFSSLLAPTTGTITWQNQTLDNLTPSIWRSHIGFVQQHSELIDDTVQNNLALPHHFNFYKNQTFNPKFHLDYLQQLNKPADFLQKNSQELSGGERQIVNLLRCLQLNPQLLLLDEPTSALDPVSAVLVENLLLKWQHSNPTTMPRSVLWISHDPMQLQRLREQGASHWTMDNGVLLC